MILKGNELKEKFNEQMQKIEVLSRDFAEFLNDKGIDESCAEEFLNYFASDSRLSEFETAYKDMLGEHIGIDYFKAVKSISNISDVIELYCIFASIAWQKKMPVAEFVKILDGNESFEIQEELEQYKPEPVEEELQYEQEEVQPEQTADEQTADEETVDEKKQEPHMGIIDSYKPQVEKNFFTQMIEDLLGVSTETLQNEEQDGNLDNLVKSITDAILEDKRKTNLINNLRKIVILANKQLVLMTDRLNNGIAVENELRNQIHLITQERDEYKKKFEDLNSKISELTSLTAFTGGTKRID